MGRKVIDLTGRVFEKLTVIKRVENDKDGHLMWLCQCDCCGENSLKVVYGFNLKNGNTQSCGCLQREIIGEFNKETKKKYNTYDLTGEYGIGYTEEGEEFYFDLEDYDKIKDYYWFKNKDEYIRTRLDENSSLFMHRLVTNCPDDMEVDHEFHDTWDNRKEFLRIVTRSQNEMNKDLKSTNTSGVTGVSWSKRNEKWRPYISINGKQTGLGYYDDFDEAVQVRKEAEIEYYKEYRYKNNQLLSNKIELDQKNKFNMGINC